MVKTSEAGGRATGADRTRYTPTGGGSGEPAAPATEAELRAAVLAAEYFLGRLRLVKAYIKANATAGTSPVAYHHMGSPEDMRSVRFGGIDYKFSDATADAAAYSITYRIKGDNDNIPEALSRHTHTIVFTSQKDAEYAAGRSKVNAGATARHGIIVNYGGNPQLHAESHEMAHNLAAARYESSFPPFDSDFRKAGASGEPAPTQYGRTNHAEDFAESVQMYVREPARLKEVAPRRYAVIKRMLEDPNYGG